MELYNSPTGGERSRDLSASVKAGSYIFTGPKFRGHEPSDDPMARKQLPALSIPRHRGVAHVDHGVLDIRVP